VPVPPVAARYLDPNHAHPRPRRFVRPRPTPRYGTGPTRRAGITLRWGSRAPADRPSRVVAAAPGARKQKTGRRQPTRPHLVLCGNLDQGERAPGLVRDEERWIVKDPAATRRRAPGGRDRGGAVLGTVRIPARERRRTGTASCPLRGRRKDGEGLPNYYSELFGWEFGEPIGPTNYAVVPRQGNTNSEGAGIGGGVGTGPEGYEGHVSFYVEVPDVGAALEKAGKPRRDPDNGPGQDARGGHRDQPIHGPGRTRDRPRQVSRSLRGLTRVGPFARNGRRRIPRGS
jgi:uncharacterized protein